MNCSDKWVVQLVVDQCKAHGISHWVFSPGSRNAPFAITVDSDPFFKTTVIHDERSAAFFALGMAERLQQPVVLCCTSGSAPTNYLPAITEAFYRNIPLLIVSADRPSAWTDQGDGQTIRQHALFSDFTHSVVHLEDGEFNETSLWKFQRETALLFGKLSPFGPAHINVGLSEPLYQTVEKTRSYERVIAMRHNYTIPVEAIDEVNQLLAGKKVMVLCGQHSPNPSLLQALGLFSERSNVAVLTENTSNLYHERFNACIDRSLNKISTENETDYRPEVLITLGGAIVSKRIKSFLRKSKLHAHINVGIENPGIDTFQQLSHSYVCEPASFFQAINSLTNSLATLNFYGKWKQLDYEAKDKMPAFNPGDDVLTDFHVYQAIFDLIPEGSVIHMANSSVIRYCQLFDLIKGCTYYANRGTSGIDGSTSTALGFASQDERLNVFITGDVSFLYDLNALQLRTIAPNLKIILINNQGGGIFRIIDGARDCEQRSTYLEAVHQGNGAVSQYFGWNYARVDDVSACQSKMTQLLNSGEINLLEFKTNAEKSPISLKDFFTFVQ
jgi:2-succinyl-5-enolpyruvyl-6-hydroxy-3-cyclohexene-1-carboxylate synthase